MKGFVKVTTMSPNVVLGDVNKNVFHIKNQFNSDPNAWISDVILFPELCLTGYSLGDLFHNTNLVNTDVWSGLEKLCSFQLEIIDSNGSCPIWIVGAPIEYNNSVYNCAIVLCNGRIEGIVPKSYLPNYKEFYESRWFASGLYIKDKEINKIKFGSNLIFETNSFKFGVELCEDLWAPLPPSTFLSLAGAEIIFNLSASNEVAGKDAYLKSLIANQSARCICGYIYSSSGYGESSTDVVYVPKSYIYENGQLLDEVKNKFNNISDYKSCTSDIDLNRIRLLRKQNTTFRGQTIIDGYSYVKLDINLSNCSLTRSYPRTTFSIDNLEEVFNIQVTGLMRRLDATSGNVVIGVSGGSDSTLALLVCYEALKRRNNKNEKIYGITMPCYGTTDRTKDNSLKMMDLLSDRVISKKILISKSVTQHRKDIELDKDDRSITYENCQARERTQVLMDYANKVGAIVVGTGDLSELALGWCTYNADHMSMYNVNVSVPKTLVKELIQWYANTYCSYDNKLFDVLVDILQTPVSPELLPDQVTEDNVGPYELHDFFLYHIMRSGWDKEVLTEIATNTFKDTYKPKEIIKWLNVFYSRFMSQQFKRSCLPDGPKVGSVSLSPRGDWRMPSDIPTRIKIL